MTFEREKLPQMGPGFDVVNPKDRFLDIVHFLILGTRGGPNRGRILECILEGPRNAHSIAQKLGLNYGTVTAHLASLVGFGLVLQLSPSGYGKGYAASPLLKENRMIVRGILARGRPKPSSSSAFRVSKGRANR